MRQSFADPSENAKRQRSIHDDAWRSEPHRSPLVCGTLFAPPSLKTSRRLSQGAHPRRRPAHAQEEQKRLTNLAGSAGSWAAPVAARVRPRGRRQPWRPPPSLPGPSGAARRSSRVRLRAPRRRAAERRRRRRGGLRGALAGDRRRIRPLRHARRDPAGADVREQANRRNPERSTMRPPAPSRSCSSWLAGFEDAVGLALHSSKLSTAGLLANPGAYGGARSSSTGTPLAWAWRKDSLLVFSSRRRTR